LVRKDFFLFGSVLIVTACLSGCRDPNRLYPVRGKVLYRGEPAVGAAVYFHRKDVADPLQEQILQGIVEQDGTFELAGANGKGALPGEYSVLIEWKQGPGIDAPDRFQGKYLDLNNPSFMAQVKPTTNELPVFEIP
jgi:hypothetical protein